MSKLDNFLSRLKKVRKTAGNTYIACCPAHQDKSPSMTIREIEQDHILIHCFAGCSVESILDTVGMNFDDVFPNRVKEDGRKKSEIPFNARDVLAALSNDASLIYMFIADLRKNKATTPEQIENAYKAVLRVYGATKMGGL